MNPEIPENQKRKKMKDDIWDISIYTDEEIIHNLLNMSNPTDRELEIKIWSSIQQYNATPPTPENLRWKQFYEQIYHRLFSFNEHEHEENQIMEGLDEDLIDAEDEIMEGLDNQNQNISTAPPPPQQQTTKPSLDEKKENKENKEDSSSTKLVTQLQYATGNVNPLLKETLSRTLTIDSQYRDNKNEPTTSFIFNLTETIKNVVNISLYSIHIPFTWYTISQNFGSNYFFIRGKSPGINNGVDDFKVEIPSGNYSQITLASAINTSFQTLKTNSTDICFGNTNIQYNVNNMLMTITVDIQNIFNQHYYYLSFPNNPLYNLNYSGNETDPSFINLRRTTIPSFLGISDISYNFDSILSSKTIPYTNSTSSVYLISNIIDVSNNIYPNNQIWIYQYEGNGLFDPSNSNVLGTYSITIPPGNYSRTSLTTTINNLLQNSYFITPTNSYFKQIPIQDTKPNQDISNSYFNLSLEINRSTTLNKQYLKTVIFLPDDTLNNNIWTGPCFQFVPQYNSYIINPNHSTTSIGAYFPFYQNELFSEYATLQTNYIIDASVCIIFKCITNYYDVSQNIFFIRVAPSNSTGYILPEYVNAIDNAFDTVTFLSSGLIIPGSQIFNQTINKPFFISDTNSIPYFDLDMNKSFNQDTYTIDISNSPLYTKLNIGNSYGYSTSTIQLIDLSSNQYQIDFSFGYLVNYDMSCDILMTVYPTKNTFYGNQNAPPFFITPVYTNNNNSKLYSNLTVLQKDIQAAFVNYTDVILNTNPIQYTKVTINPSVQGIFPNNYYTGKIVFSINNALTETNYSMSFYDPQNSWSNYLHFNDNSGVYLNTDVSYILSDYHVSGQSYSEIAGNNVVLNEIMQIDNSNNTFYIKPLPSSNSLQDISNSYIYTIPNGDYTRDQLIIQINKAFQSYNDTYNTYLGLKTINEKQYSFFYIEINKTFTASDYEIIFYDSRNFQKCSLGRTSTGNASWDTTLGWILGFREYTSYSLTNYITTAINPPSQLNDICTIVADTTCSTTLFNYFILTMDDFNQNHTNDGLVTITTIEKSIPLPSYANRSDFVCDPSSGLYLYTGITSSGTNNLTQNQIYSITEIMNNNVNASTLNGNVPITKYSYGPFISDVLAIVPVKTAGVVNGQTIIVDGGTLQTQNRKYFGPINLNRLLITLYDDRGHVVNLNNSNWSFTLLVDQIYKKSAASS